MIFTLNYYFNFTLFFVFSYVLTITTSYYHLTGYWSIDLHTRSDINLVGLSNLFWIWTNTYYLYSVLIIALFTYMLHFYKNLFSWSLLLLAIYCTLIFLELFTNHNLVSSTTYKTADLELYNLLLNNSINKIHPLMIYAAWFSTLILIIVNPKVLSAKNSIVNLLLLFKLVIFISLLLGGWWAYQEGSWGGWWNWDPSEMFGLLILFSLASLTHNSVRKSYIISYYIKVLISYTFIYYIFLQLNFSLLSHNFGIRQGDIIDFRISYLTAIVFIIYFVIRKLAKLVVIVIPNLYSLGKPYYYYIASFVLYIILYISSAELWSDLVWRLLNIDLYNSSSLLGTSLLVATLIFVLRYFDLMLINTILVFLFIYTNNIVVPLTFYFLNISWLKYIDLHKIILGYVLFTFMYSSFSSTLWTSELIVGASNSIVLNLPLLHGDSISSLSKYLNYYSQLNSNTIETKPFSLSNYNNITEQRYSISLDDILISSSTNDFSNLLVISIILIFIALFTRSINNILIIKF